MFGERQSAGDLGSGLGFSHWLWDLSKVLSFYGTQNLSLQNGNSSTYLTGLSWELTYTVTRAFCVTENSVQSCTNYKPERHPPFQVSVALSV